MLIIRCLQQGSLFFVLSCFGIWCIQQHPSIQNNIQSTLLSLLAQELNATIAIKQSNINLLTGTCTLLHGKVTPTLYPQTSWSFQKAHVRIAFWQSIFAHKLSLIITLHDVQANTIIQDGYVCPLVEHIYTIIALQNPLIPCTLHTITAHNVTITLTGKSQKSITAEFVGSCAIKKETTNTRIATFQGTCEGSLRLLHETTAPFYHISATWGEHASTIMINNKQHTTHHVHINLHDQLITADGTASTQDIIEALKLHNLLSEPNTTLTSLLLKTTDTLCSFNLQHTKNTGGVGSMSFSNPAYGSLTHQLVWNNNLTELSCTGTNQRPIVSGKRWLIAKDGIRTTYYHHQQHLAATINLMLHDTIHNNSHALVCDVQRIQDELVCTGTLDDFAIHAIFQLDPIIKLKRASLSLHKKEIASCTQRDALPIITGTFHYALLERFLPDLPNIIPASSSSLFAIMINGSNQETLTGTIELASGHLYMPGCMNIITQGKSDWTYLCSTKTLLITQATARFAQGLCHCPIGSITFDENGTFKTCNLQVLIKNLLLNWKHDIYALISASGNLHKKPHDDTWHINGNLVINKGLVKAFPTINPTSSNSAPLESLIPFPIKGSLHITNKNPLEIKTPFLSSFFDLNLHLSAVSADPSSLRTITCDGTIKLDGGNIEIGSYKLLIEHGELICHSGIGHSPYIRFTAKNRINIYALTMHVSGFLDNPNVDFETTPHLSTEQIIGLLFAGTEQATIQTNMASMLIKKIYVSLDKQLQQPKKKYTPWQILGQSLKHIQFTPDFTDARGQASVKGIIAVDIGNRLFGRAQKGLNTNDDFVFEVDYLLTDTFYGKITKNHHGDIGAEIEVRLRLPSMT